MNITKFVFGALPASNSPSGSINSLDLQKTGRVFLVVVAGSAATAALDFITSWLTGVDLGPYRAILAPAIMGLLELGRRYIAQHLTPTQDPE